MPFLTLNGIRVPILVAGFGKPEPELIGDRGRALNGAMRVTHVSTKRRWRGTMAHATPADAAAWRSLLMLEDWDAVSFDAGLYSGKGVAPTGSGGISGTSPKYGAGNLSTGASGVTYPFGLGSIWTVSLWHWSGTVWNHYVVRSDGAKWLNGVRADATSTTFLSVSAGGDVSLAASQSIDDLAVFAFLLPADWPAYIHAATTAFTCPDLTAAGDAIEGGPRSVSPTVGSANVMPATIGGTFYTAVETLDLELEEA